MINWIKGWFKSEGENKPIGKRVYLRSHECHYTIDYRPALFEKKSRKEYMDWMVGRLSTMGYSVDIFYCGEVYFLGSECIKLVFSFVATDGNEVEFYKAIAKAEKAWCEYDIQSKYVFC